MKRRTFLTSTGIGAGMAVSGVRLSFAQTPSPVASPAASPAADGHYPSGVAGVPDAYTRMPKPFKSYDGTPGKGGKVQALTMTYSAPPTPKANNSYWKALDKALGVDWDPIIVPWESYGEKASAIIASGDMPDMFYLNYNQTQTPLITFTQQGAFRDLSDFLTGDALKKYPNLATFSESMWNATKLEGKIFGVPCPMPAVSGGGSFRRDWADKYIGGPATNGKDWYELARAVTKDDPDGNGKGDTWAFAPYWRFSAGVAPNFGGVNEWGVDAQGKFVSTYETEAYQKSLEYHVKMMKDGLYHPDSRGLGLKDAQAIFSSGRSLAFADGNSPYGKDGWDGKIKQYFPNGIAERHAPFPMEEGGEIVTGRGSGTFGFTAIPSTITDDDRVDELLRIFDWLASPFGSEEWILRTAGIEGEHFTYNKDGWPETNDKYSADQEGLTIFLANPMPVNIKPAEPELAVREMEDQLAVYKYAVEDPTAPLYSAAKIEKGGVMEQVIDDALIEIFSGRRDVSEWSKVVADWRSKGGDTVRGEYEKAHAANQ